MKTKAIALILSCLAFQAFAQVRVDLTGIVSTDFIATPTVDQATSALNSGDFFGGFGWEVVLGNVGLGGDYLARFDQTDQSDWTVEWDSMPLYASFHILGGTSFIDPYVFAGLGTSGIVGISPSNAGDLALSVFPLVGAGASAKFGFFRLGAKLGYSLGDSPVPGTTIPAHPLGRFHLAATASFSVSTEDIKKLWKH